MLRKHGLWAVHANLCFKDELFDVFHEDVGWQGRHDTARVSGGDI